MDFFHDEKKELLGFYMKKAALRTTYFLQSINDTHEIKQTKQFVNSLLRDLFRIAFERPQGL